MQYRLRTLLIAVTAACMFLAWAAYLQRKAHHHRQKATSLMLRISLTDNLQQQKVEEAIQWLVAGTAKEIRSKEKVNGRTVVSFRKRPPFFQADVHDWEGAAYHYKMAAAYDNALLCPWKLRSTKPAP